MVHDEHPVGEALDHRQVVADEEIAQPHLAAQCDEEVEYLRLHRHIEGGYRFVAHQYVGPHSERASDDDALALAPENWCGNRLA